MVVFNNTIEISNLDIDIETSVNNVLMSFVNNTNEYKNSHGIPYIANNKPPVVKVFNSYGDLVDTITLTAYYDYLDTDERKIIENFEEKISEYYDILDVLNKKAEFNI